MSRFWANYASRMPVRAVILAAVFLPHCTFSQSSPGNRTGSVSEHATDEYGNAYRLQADLAVWNLSQREVEDVREGLRRVVFDAFHRSMSRRLTPQKWRLPTQSAALFNGLSMANETNPFDVQILRVLQRPEGHIRVEFVVTLSDGGAPVPAEVLIEDLSFLTLSHISATLRYPVTGLTSEYEVQRSIQSSWWIIALFVGSALLIVLCCWAALFLYYNTCGRPLPELKPASEQLSSTIRDVRRIAHRKTQTDRAYLVEAPGDGPTRRQRESTTALEKSRLPSEGSSSVAAAVAIDAHDAVNGKLGSPLPPPNRSHDAAEVPKRESPEFVEEYDGESDEDSRQQYNEEDVRREDSGFSHQSVASRRSSRLDRPKSALPQRPIRTLEGEVIGRHPSAHRWSPYDAGDAVAAIYAIGPALSSYPTPIPPTDSGVLELSVTDPFKQIL